MSYLGSNLKKKARSTPGGQIGISPTDLISDIFPSSLPLFLAICRVLVRVTFCVVRFLALLVLTLLPAIYYEDRRYLFPCRIGY